MIADDILLDRSAVEDFLYLESDLLDQWKLDEWLALFAPGARYEIPPAFAEDDASATESLFFVADDYVRLQHRVTRLKNRNAHSEFPRSRGFRMIGNVRRMPGEDANHIRYRCKFMTLRSRDDITDAYFGHQHYALACLDGHIRIASKRTILDGSSLRPQGRISILL